MKGKGWIERAKARRDARADKRFDAKTERMAKGGAAAVKVAELALLRSNGHVMEWNAQLKKWE